MPESRPPLDLQGISLSELQRLIDERRSLPVDKWNPDHCGPSEMRIAREEVFGPVLSVIRFRNDDEAIAIANDSVYGLAAGIWTQSIKRAIRVSERLQAGSVWVNTYRAVSYLSPFGGYKRSVIGRENGREAIFEYLQTKSIWISTAEEVPNPFVMR